MKSKRDNGNLVDLFIRLLEGGSKCNAMLRLFNHNYRSKRPLPGIAIKTGRRSRHTPMWIVDKVALEKWLAASEPWRLAAYEQAETIYRMRKPSHYLMRGSVTLTVNGAKWPNELFASFGIKK